MDLGLKGKVALVTGSYRGTGEGTAKVLAREGASTIVHGFQPGEADRVVAEIRATGASVAGIHGNLMEDIDASETAQRAVEAFGRIDILINNYGVAERGSWFAGDTADWTTAYEKNVLSGVRLIRHLVPAMKERGWGRVILVSTVGATRPNSNMPMYYGAKAALANLAVSLAKELAHTGITVNTVSPGLIATRELREGFTRAAQRRGESSEWADVQRKLTREQMPTPTGFVGEVEDVGNLIAFLVSDLGRYINGANLRIDGGSADCVN